MVILCHSDLVAINGERAKPVPMVIGHEVSGIVATVGPDVDGLAVGEHVVTVYVAKIMVVVICVRKDALPSANRQPIANKAGTLIDVTTRLHSDGQLIFHHSGVAAFSEYAVISQNALVRIDPEIPFEVATSIDVRLTKPETKNNAALFC